MSTTIHHRILIIGGAGSPSPPPAASGVEEPGLEPSAKHTTSPVDLVGGGRAPAENPSALRSPWSPKAWHGSGRVASILSHLVTTAGGVGSPRPPDPQPRHPRLAPVPGWPRHSTPAVSGNYSYELTPPGSASAPCARVRQILDARGTDQMRQGRRSPTQPTTGGACSATSASCWCPHPPCSGAGVSSNGSPRATASTSSTVRVTEIDGDARRPRSPTFRRDHLVDRLRLPAHCAAPVRT